MRVINTYNNNGYTDITPQRVAAFAIRQGNISGENNTPAQAEYMSTDRGAVMFLGNFKPSVFVQNPSENNFDLMVTGTSRFINNAQVRTVIGYDNDPTLTAIENEDGSIGYGRPRETELDYPDRDSLPINVSSGFYEGNTPIVTYMHTLGPDDDFRHFNFGDAMHVTQNLHFANRAHQIMSNRGMTTINLSFEENLGLLDMVMDGRTNIQVV